MYKRGDIIKKDKTVQDWLIIENISKEGLIKIKENEIYVKILKVSPINFNLKTNLEKEAILNSYKKFLKMCNFDIQILIHTKKEDISKIVNNIKESKEKNISLISNKYIEFLKKINSQKNSSTKNYYIIISQKIEESKNIEDFNYKLNEKYHKIKEALSHCGNFVKECKRNEVIKIFDLFLNSRKNLRRYGGDKK